MREQPTHHTYAKAGLGERVLQGVETAGKIYSAAHTAYGIPRGTAAVAVRLAPLFGLL